MMENLGALGGRRGDRWRFSRWAYGGGVMIAVGAAGLLVLVNLAVGFLGSEDNPANLIFSAVLAVAVIGSIGARFQPSGMARAMHATAAMQGLVGLIALAAGLGSTGWKGLYEVVMGSCLFMGLWLLSAWLFGKAAGHRAFAVSKP